jgi:hypothetical protein
VLLIDEPSAARLPEGELRVSDYREAAIVTLALENFRD